MIGDLRLPTIVSCSRFSSQRKSGGTRTRKPTSFFLACANALLNSNPSDIEKFSAEKSSLRHEQQREGTAGLPRFAETWSGSRRKLDRNLDGRDPGHAAG
jgi:hypothetical protein